MKKSKGQEKPEVKKPGPVQAFRIDENFVTVEGEVYHRLDRACVGTPAPWRKSK